MMAVALGDRRAAPRWMPGEISVRTWTMTIVHRRVVDRLRANRAQAGETGSLPHGPAGLPERQRKALVLAYYQGRTYREIAEVLDVPAGVVMAELREGLTRLRACAT